MRIIESLSFHVSLALLTSCSSTVIFPVSQITPGADITLEIRDQGAFNSMVTVTANNLAASDRLSPPKEFYIIWTVSESDIIRNVGQFAKKNEMKSTYKASFPYKIVEIFITAENEDGLCQPEGIELTRIKF